MKFQTLLELFYGSNFRRSTLGRVLGKVLFTLEILATGIKEIKHASECIVALYVHAGIFKNTSEVKREAWGAAECFSHFSSVLKNSQVLIKLNNARG